jgi:hypothetical protein
MGALGPTGSDYLNVQGRMRKVVIVRVGHILLK